MAYGPDDLLEETTGDPARVAELLGITRNTAAGYVKSIYRKLGISTRAEASWHATRLGL